MLQSSAQNKEPYVRIAKIVGDPSQLENYRAALKEGIETAVSTEPGVLRKYKTGTLNMVKSFELIDVVPIAFASKRE
jgi:hypothetical protein